MKVIIMGCGRVGEQVSLLMAEAGHSVVVIDYDPEALARLGTTFKGQRILGIGFDRDVLLQAGVENADAFAATSSSDTANIVAARIARNVFHVPRVVARLFDRGIKAVKGFLAVRLIDLYLFHRLCDLSFRFLLGKNGIPFVPA